MQSPPARLKANAREGDRLQVAEDIGNPEPRSSALKNENSGLPSGRGKSVPPDIGDGEVRDPEPLLGGKHRGSHRQAGRSLPRCTPARHSSECQREAESCMPFKTLPAAPVAHQNGPDLANSGREACCPASIVPLRFR